MKDAVEKYIKLEKEPNHRYRSWEHCFLAFSDKKDVTDNKTIDYLSLHLAFYLASWGMYRGSSQLLQNDYKIHIPVVKIILAKGQKLNQTWLDGKKDIDLINNLLNHIGRVYEGFGVSATDTLLTKVLLGTLGCIPAFDRYFREGWKDIDGRDLSIKNIADFTAIHRKEIEECQEWIKDELKMKYPSMKIIDMYFWQHGYDMNKK